MVESIHAECGACRGTGVYTGMCEAKGTAVVCVRCGGTGCETITYRPFVVRRRREGVETVRWSRGSLLATGVGVVGESIAYAEFLGGKMPPKGR